MSALVGKELRKKREEKNLTLTQVSDDLFIRTTYLQAIENGRPEILPSAVQGRGFVRMYAEYLGLDTEKLLRAWEHPDEDPTNETILAESTDIPSAAEQTQPRPNTPPIKPRDRQSAEQTAPEPDPVENIFREIGAALRERRESLSLSYQDAENYTLVREYYLKLIEDGEFDKLPSSVQARGMLNNYASFLNLDVENILLRYAEAIQLYSKQKSERLSDPKEKRKCSKQKPVKKAGKLKQFLTPDLFVGLFVLLGMAGIILYSAATISDFRSRAVESTTDVRDAFIEHIEQNDRDNTPTSQPSQTPQPDLSATTSGDTGEDETVQLTGAIQVFIEANQRAFLQVKSDGKDVFTGRTVPGNTYPFDAGEVIEITTGNAAALSVTYNQQRLGILGNLGESLTLQFNGGVPITPTPLVSPTPTNTFQPTYTPMPETAVPTATITPYIP